MSDCTILAMLPTWNEAENIADLVHALLQIGPEYGVVVVDDNSPDETWKVVDRLSETFPGRVHLVRRLDEKGRGSAGIRGFLECLQRGAEVVVEMDADWSHHPRHIPDLVAPVLAGEADVCIGSRLVQGGGEAGRSPLRRGITLCANGYIRLLLGLDLRDCTSGFRVFHRSVLERVDFSRLDSNGPAIVQEMLMVCKAQGCRFVERPIRFEERRAGESTFNARIMLAGLAAVVKFRLRRWENYLRDST